MSSAVCSHYTHRPRWCYGRADEEGHPGSFKVAFDINPLRIIPYKPTRRSGFSR